MTTRSAARPAREDLRRPVPHRSTLMRLAREEYERFSRLLESLDTEDWQRPTVCPGWDVRAMASHVLGMAEMAASIREGKRQQRLAGRAGGAFIDALTELQVSERQSMPPNEMTTRFRRIGPRAARGRRLAPGFIRRRALPVPQSVGGRDEWWTIGFINDVILTRDTWMHRVDISDAVGRQLELTADHDGVLVADVVDEWASRHGQPFDLTLSGPAGGGWSTQGGGEQIDMDAVEFCRQLSGRGVARGLLATEVPF